MELTEIIGTLRGCISIAQPSQPDFAAAFGYADLANQVKNTLATRFATASAGKVFVSVAILQLIEEGRLHFTDPIGSLLDLSLKAIDPSVTVEQLLTHRSGISDYFDEAVMTDYAQLWENFPNYRIRRGQDLLPLFINKPMVNSPGEKFQYNNAGFTLLGLILEQVTGQLFDQCLAERIFNRAGMTQTGYFELDRLPKGCATHYIYDPASLGYYTNIYSVDAKGSGAGGAYLTIGDMEAFWNALLTYQLLSPEMTHKMLSVQSANSEDDHYGYGIWLGSDQHGSRRPYITGSDPGVSFISSFDLEQQRLVTLVSNFEDNVWSMHRQIQVYLDEQRD